MKDTSALGELSECDTARIVKKRCVQVHLTPIEYRLLGGLVATAGRVMTHPYLLREVWGPTHAETLERGLMFRNAVFDNMMLVSCCQIEHEATNMSLLRKNFDMTG